ncbi:hypothetical protein IWZ03DRAFT_383691 [Phyllosticta citriasiana]|uniref:Uncharacterized protein n=1 Tax=Phyllosticta citriasiana TaxID=595635 RepID=A0ABR1KI31_9PEZI
MEGASLTMLLSSSWNLCLSLSPPKLFITQYHHPSYNSLHQSAGSFWAVRMLKGFIMFFTGRLSVFLFILSINVLHAHAHNRDFHGSAKWKLAQIARQGSSLSSFPP